MPKALEMALAKKAKEKGIKKHSKRWGKYVFGGLRKMGWKPNTQKISSKGKDYDKK